MITSASSHFTSAITTHSLPPKPPLPNPSLQLPVNVSRREAILFSFIATIPYVAQPDSSTALSIGISGPKEWLKEQKKKSAKFLLAPIDASRETLRFAYQLLTTNASELSGKELVEVQKLLRSASRDCVPQERNSIVSFQANTGVEVCTFRLIIKNAASLLDKKDPVKLEAESMLDDLIRSFTYLNGVANEADIQLASSRQKVVDALMDTLSSLDKFEQGVKNCLEA